MATLNEIRETLINSGVPATEVTVDMNALSVDVNLGLWAQIEISFADPAAKDGEDGVEHEIAIRSYDQTHGLDYEQVIAHVHRDFPHLIVGVVQAAIAEEAADAERQDAQFEQEQADERAYFYEPPRDEPELVCESRRNAGQRWTQVASASTYASLRPKVLDELERLGFTFDRYLLADDLDPSGKADPAADYMTEDNGAQIRVYVR